MAGYEQSLDRDGGRRERHGWISRAVSAVQDALEAESERWFVWLPVLFSCGILLYFSLPTEPDARVALALPLIALAIAVGARQATFGLLLGGALLALAAGFATAKIRTDSVSAPVLSFHRVAGLDRVHRGTRA
jgi:competence protein ComEC